jgi:hypothetical protein
VDAGDLPFDDGLQPIVVLFKKAGEFKRLAVPCYGRQHLGLAGDAAFAGEEHQLSDRAGLHRPLQAEQAAGYRNDLQLRGASDTARKPYYHRGFFFESNALRPFAKLSLGGVGHELSITIFVKNREITEGPKSYEHSAKIDVMAMKPAPVGQFKAKAKALGSRDHNFRQPPEPRGPGFGFDSQGAVCMPRRSRSIVGDKHHVLTVRLRPPQHPHF